jgi:hypothetical protein
MKALAKAIGHGLHHDVAHELAADAGGRGRKGNRLPIAAPTSGS